MGGKPSVRRVTDHIHVLIFTLQLHNASPKHLCCNCYKSNISIHLFLLPTVIGEQLTSVKLSGQIRPYAKKKKPKLREP